MSHPTLTHQQHAREEWSGCRFLASIAAHHSM
jgi:hypothetical protein